MKNFNKTLSRNVDNAIGSAAESTLVWLFILNFSALFLPQARLLKLLSTWRAPATLGAIFLLMFAREASAQRENENEEVVEGESATE